MNRDDVLAARSLALHELGKRLKRYVRQDPEIAALSFWLRKSNLDAIAEELSTRQGLARGSVLHIAPSNVSLNFCYPWSLSFLIGNSNQVRLSSRASKLVDILLTELEECSALSRQLGTVDNFFREGPSGPLLQKFSEECDVRLIWGANNTIKVVRETPLKPSAIDVAFADYQSVVVARLDASLMERNSLARIADRVARDISFANQNACTSPHILHWAEPPKPNHRTEFWRATSAALEKRASLQGTYQKELFLADSFSTLYFGRSPTAEFFPFLAVVHVTDQDIEISKRRGAFNVVMEVGKHERVSSTRYSGASIQTLGTIGLSNDEAHRTLMNHGAARVLRITPVGSMHEFSVIWDGHNLYDLLQRPHPARIGKNFNT